MVLVNLGSHCKAQSEDPRVPLWSRRNGVCCQSNLGRNAFSVQYKMCITVPRLSVDEDNFIEDLHLVYLVLLNYVTRPEETQSWSLWTETQSEPPPPHTHTHICMSTDRWGRGGLNGWGGVTWNLFSPRQCKSFKIWVSSFLSFLSFTKIPRKPFPTVGVEWSSGNVTNIDAVTPSNKMCLKAQTVQHIGWSHVKCPESSQGYAPLSFYLF